MCLHGRVMWPESCDIKGLAGSQDRKWVHLCLPILLITQLLIVRCLFLFPEGLQYLQQFWGWSSVITNNFCCFLPNQEMDWQPRLKVTIRQLLLLAKKKKKKSFHFWPTSNYYSLLLLHIQSKTRNPKEPTPDPCELTVKMHTCMHGCVF